MEITFQNYCIAPIHEKDAWRLCDLMVANSDRFKDFFPETLKSNLTPTLSELFVSKKVKQFQNKEEYLFTIKENTSRTIIGLIYVKELQKVVGQGELAYCIGYQYGGKGLMTKIVGKVSSWAFEQANLDTLQIIVHKTNVPSIKVAKNTNFTWKKTLPKIYEIPGKDFVDMELYERYKV